MKRVLIVAYYFPPLATSGAMRPLGFCRHLHEWGWAPRVVAADPSSLTPPLPVDEELGTRVPKAIRVERVGHVAPVDVLVRIRNRVLGRPDTRQSAPAERATPPVAGTRSTLRALAELAIEHLFLFPDRQRWWRGRAVRAGARGERPDVVYATGGPWTALMVGRALARWYGVPFVADFRDPWSRNPFHVFPPLIGARTRRLERNICRAAARVVLNTTELRDQFVADYPEMRGKFVAVSNGFDDGAGGRVMPSPARAEPGAAQTLELWHFGAVYGKRTPQALLEAVSRLRASGHLRPGRLRIHFVGTWEDSDASSRLAERLEADGIVTRTPPVAHQTCLTMMRDAQTLLVVQPDSPLQVPGKIFEYVSMGRPLLVIGGEGATAGLVHRHRLGECVANDVEAIETLLARLIDGDALPVPPAAAASQFTYRTLTRQLAGVLDAVVGDVTFHDAALEDVAFEDVASWKGSRVCGIAGVFNFRSQARADAAAVRRMADVVAHRGPDADGYYVHGPVGLAHRRLAILDLSEQGRQPMYTADGRFAMVFNGEIYNYLELREKLERDGHRFRTQTDSEVLLTLYALEGAASLSRLQGMFAIGIWDTVRRELFLARDRVGIKPLYYAETSDGIVFGSEAKSLFEYPGVTRAVDRGQIDTFMTFGYVPGAETMFRGVRKLLPGHCVTINVDTDRLECREYWDVRYAPDRSRSAEDTASELHDLLLDVTRVHLRSDVPVGVFLSGGLDSSAVVSLLSEAGISGIKTFAVAYRDGPEFDESEYAGLVSRHFGTEHRVLYVDPAQFQEFIPDYVWHMDEPVTEAAALSLYFVSRELRQHVTVALSGEGADELFAGYQIYRYMLWLERYRRAPSALRSGVVEPILAAFARGKMAKYLEMARRPLSERYLGVGVSEPWQRTALYSASMRDDVARAGTGDVLLPYYDRSTGQDALSRMLYLDLKTWLVDDLLIKADKMTMANGVELRVPFLDHRVVEFAATVPSDLKLRGGSAKWILKKAMASRLPPEILARRKVGFPTPLERMFRSPMAAYLRDVLLSPRAIARDYFDPAMVSRLVSEHTSGARDHHRVLWQLVVLEEWHRAFIDAPRVSSGGMVDRVEGIAV